MQPTGEIEPHHLNLAFLDETNPRSMVSLSPKGFAEVIKSVPKELFGWSEEQLRQAGNIRVREKRIRLSLWTEYNRASYTGDKMVMQRVCGTPEDHNYFYQVITKDPHKMAFMLTMPADYNEQVSGGLSHGLERCMEILALPVVDRAGTVDKSVMNAIIKITMWLDARKNGGIVQKTFNVNKNIDEKEKPKSESVVDIDARLKELEDRAKPKIGTIQTGFVEISTDVKEDAEFLGSD